MNAGRVVGRDAEIAVLGRILAAVEGGRAAIVIVEGESGIGKTRLLEEARAGARNRGHYILEGAGYELGHERSYRVIADALELRRHSDDPLRAAIADLLCHPPDEGRLLEYRLLEDILALVERLSIERPVLLTVDDLQWADAASLASLAHLAHDIGPLRVALLCAVRPPPRRPRVDEFLRTVSPLATWLRLEALAGPAVESLVADLIGEPPTPDLLKQVERAGGNPLFVRELALALRGGQPLPPSIHALVQRRLGGLPEPAAHLLRMASVLGSDFVLTDLADFTGRPAAQLTEALEPALQGGLLVAAGHRLAFRHQLVRDAVYAQIPLAVRSALHRDVGRALARRQAGPLQVATHLALAGESGRTEAVDWLRRAAAEAASSSPALAVELLDRALELGDARHPQRQELLVDRAVALTWAGRADESLRAAVEMLPKSVGSGSEGRLRQGIARALMVQGRWAESAEQLEVLGARADAPELDRARLLGDAALAAAHCGDLSRAADLADRARREGERLGDELTESIALSSLAVVSHFEARHRETVTAARRALELAVRSPHPEAALRPVHVWLGLGLADVDEFDEAREVLAAGRRLSEDAGMRWQLPLYHDGIGTIHFYSGDWDDAVAEMETCIELARQMGTLWWLVPANCMLAYIAIHRDHDQLAQTTIQAARQHAGTAGDFGTDRMLWVEGLHEEVRGNPERALTLLQEGWDVTKSAGFLPHHLIIGPDLVRVALSTGARERAREVAATVEQIAGRTGVASAVAVADRCLGLVEDDADRMARAVASLRRSPRRADLAFACEEAGVAAARAGLTAEGVGLLEEALAGFRRCGANRGVRRVLAQLHALGVRRRGPRRPHRPVVGWGSLTETEQRVAELASRGLTNPEIGGRLFISRRTVATHLSHVFGKLAISSRVELARIAAEQHASGQRSVT